MIVTGEVLPAAAARDWLRAFPAIPIMNAYGPTECSDDVTHHSILTPPSQSEISVPIGKGVDNTRIYILDSVLLPVPIGVIGRLHVGGSGVGRGYLYAPRQTAKVFLPDPFANAPGARMYDTGDLARYLPDGSIEFLGRVDHQIKLHGYRIELGEIEAAIHEHGTIRHCVVVTQRSSTNTDQLVAYLELEKSEEETTTGGPANASADNSHIVANLRESLRNRLPHYMVPAILEPVPKIPMTTSGKVDRQRLPAPQSTFVKSANFVAPTGNIQIEIARIWRQVLGVEILGSDDRFFDVGGDSLKAMKAYRLLDASFPGHLTMIDMFKYNSVKELSDFIATAKSAPTATTPVVEAFEV
jgi:acyl-coenzyme A synthetase/AMP-(fatty) acid ligase